VSHAAGCCESQPFGASLSSCCCWGRRRCCASCVRARLLLPGRELSMSRCPRLLLSFPSCREFMHTLHADMVRAVGAVASAGGGGRQAGSGQTSVNLALVLRPQHRISPFTSTRAPCWLCSRLTRFQRPFSIQTTPLKQATRSGSCSSIDTAQDMNANARRGTPTLPFTATHIGWLTVKLDAGPSVCIGALERLTSHVLQSN
jgi:hypothetical protein